MQFVPRFRGYQQQDAHEFLRYMLEQLNTELLTFRNQYSHRINLENFTIVTSIFGGILQNEVKCLICGNESKKHEPFFGMYSIDNYQVI